MEVYYIRKVNEVKLANIMFSLLCVCVFVSTQPSLQQRGSSYRQKPIKLYKFIRLVCEKLTIFPYGQDILETSFYWLSDDIVRFKIEVGVEEKFNTYITQNGLTAARRLCALIAVRSKGIDHSLVDTHQTVQLLPSEACIIVRRQDP